MSEVAEELVVGDFDDSVLLHEPSLKVKESQASVRKQIDEIVAGAFKIAVRIPPSQVTYGLRSALPVKETT